MRTTLVKLTDGRLPFVAAGHEVWTSLEGENPGGSIKDRMVEAELRAAVARGELEPGSLVTEISAGSTARSLAYFAREMGFGCELFVPHSIKEELKASLSSLGARLHLVDPASAYAEYDAYCASRKPWRLDQMQRVGLKDHYTSWAARDLKPRLGRIDAVIGSVGTGHSLLGIARALDPRSGPVAAEPTEAKAIPGIRNLHLERYPGDPCSKEDFSSRIEVAREDFCPFPDLQSDLGRIVFSDSFRVALAATATHLRSLPPNRVFILGSHNRAA